MTPANPDSMAKLADPSDTRQFADAEDSRCLKEYTKTHSACSNDCDWLHRLASSDAITVGRTIPRYLVRVYYKGTQAASTSITKDYGTGPFTVLDLRHCLASKYVRAVTLCHRDSFQVDTEILDLVWCKFKLEVSFMRHTILTTRNSEMN